MKRNAIIRIVIWSIVLLLLAAFLVTTLLFRSFSYSAWNGMERESTPMHALPSEEGVAFHPEDVRELEIEWVAGSIILQPADVEEITVTESDVTEEKYAMLYQLRNGKLSIQFCEDAFVSGFGINFNADITKDLYIQVPRDWECDSLEIDAASATVEVNDLTIREVEFDGASGTCEFDNCAVNTFDMDTASGDVRISGTLDTLDFDGASASIYAELTNTPNRMDIDTMSGDLDLTLPQDCGFTVSLNAMSGDFSSDFKTTTQNGSHVHGDGSCRINVDAMSGDVILRKCDSSGHHTHDDSCYEDGSTCPDYGHH